MATRGLSTGKPLCQGCRAELRFGSRVQADRAREDRERERGGGEPLHKPRLGVHCAGSCCCLKIFKLFHRITKMTKRHAQLDGVCCSLLLHLKLLLLSPTTIFPYSAPNTVAASSSKPLLLQPPQTTSISCCLLLSPPPPTPPPTNHTLFITHVNAKSLRRLCQAGSMLQPGQISAACSARDLRLTIIIGD